MKKKSIIEAVDAAEESENPQESCDISEKQDDCSIVYQGAEIKTASELLSHTKIDLKIWEIVETSINRWEIAGRKRNGQNSSGRWRPDGLWKTGLLQIKVRLKRKAPKNIQDGIRELIKDLKPLPVVKPSSRKRKDGHCLELCLFDHHFGKMCWGAETGTNMDLSIANREYRQAIDDMLKTASAFNVDEILFPFGNDFFHSNDWQSQTANGTRVDSTDDRFSKVFRVACQALQYAIERCVEVAPVGVLYIPGNHDKNSSWYAAEWLSAIFRGNKHIDIDNSPTPRKYRLIKDVNLLGFTHGNLGKHNDYPTLMATEAPELWAKAKHRAWHIGHFHRQREVRHTSGDSFNGCVVRTIGSLSGTDSWHFENGFTGSARLAESFLWSKSGPVGSFVSHSKEPLIPRGSVQ